MSTTTPNIAPSSTTSNYVDNRSPEMKTKDRRTHDWWRAVHKRVDNETIVDDVETWTQGDDEDRARMLITDVAWLMNPDPRDYKDREGYEREKAAREKEVMSGALRLARAILEAAAAVRRGIDKAKEKTIEDHDIVTTEERDADWMKALENGKEANRLAALVVLREKVDESKRLHKMNAEDIAAQAASIRRIVERSSISSGSRSRIFDELTGIEMAIEDDLPKVAAPAVQHTKTQTRCGNAPKPAVVRRGPVSKKGVRRGA